MSSAQGYAKSQQGKATSDRHSVVFIGYKLPDNITKDDIFILMHEYKQSVINVEVLYKKKGNVAKVTFATSSAAQAAIKQYSGQYWYQFGVRIVLKPWDEQRGSSVVRKKQKHANEDVSLFDNSCMIQGATHYSQFTSSKEVYSQGATHYPQFTSSKEIYSQGATCFLSPYPGHTVSIDKVQTCTLTMDSRLNTYEDNFREYTIKIYGLSLDVNKSEIFHLVKPFGELTSPVKVNRYPANCYAYVNYYNQSSAVAAVSALNGKEFNGTRIHVCHKGGLEVTHNCRNEHHTLNDVQKLMYGSLTQEGPKQVQKSDALTQ